MKALHDNAFANKAELKQRKQKQSAKIDSLSNMYLRLYAWKA